MPHRSPFAVLALSVVVACGCRPASRGESLPVLAAPPSGSGPEAPRALVDTTPPVTTGIVRSVRPGEDLQQAIDAARPGDEIRLQAGAVFRGPFTLPAKDGAGWIVIRTSDERGLPPAGSRVSPAHARAMPVLEAATGPVISAATGAHHYRLLGLEIRPAAGTFLHDLVRLGLAETRPQDVPHHIVLDRCYLHGDAREGARRGVALNSAHSAVIDSYLADFKEEAGDSQAIAGWNGPGPFRIVNNHLEAAGENLMFGGADPTIRDLVPADIEIRRNRLVKPLAWKPGEPGHEGRDWAVKNLFELKNARRVIVEGNLLERCWSAAQTGFGVLFTVRNQDGAAPWSTVEDVRFASNLLRGMASGVNVLGHDTRPSGRLARLLVRNNLFEDVGGPRWGGEGRLFQILDGPLDVVIEHNTAFQTGNVITASGEPSRGFVFRDNILAFAGYGIVGDGTSPGLATLSAYFPQAEFRRNVVAGADPRLHPPDNFYPASLELVGFSDLASGDYRLAVGSAYRGRASDGRDPGVDLGALLAALGLERLEEE